MRARVEPAYPLHPLYPLSDTARQFAARLLCVGFHGHEISASLRRLLAEGVNKVVLFARNIQSPAQVAALTDQIRAAADHPVLICIDQEGGRVRRLREGFTQVPSMRQLGAAAAAMGNAAASQLARGVGLVLGRELAAVGVNVNFAPVLDVDTNPDNPVIADRSLHRDAEVVARLGSFLIDGIQAGGVAACGKHFPGHGDTLVDSHYDLPALPHSLERLRSIELLPFSRCLHAACMMTAHIIFPTLDAAFPATLSRELIDPILRQEMGYDGVVFTDDMEMKAIADHYGFDDAVVRAVEAGVDVLTICHSEDRQARAIEVLAAAIDGGRISEARVQRSSRRLDRLSRRFGHGRLTDLSVLGSTDHLAAVAPIELAAAAADPTEAWRGNGAGR
jgi:beta-N-acetylhexosaminidase